MHKEALHISRAGLGRVVLVMAACSRNESRVQEMGGKPESRENMQQFGVWLFMQQLMGSCSQFGRRSCFQCLLCWHQRKDTNVHYSCKKPMQLFYGDLLKVLKPDLYALLPSNML